MSKEIWNSEKAVVVEVFMVFFLQKKITTYNLLFSKTSFSFSPLPMTRVNCPAMSPSEMGVAGESPSQGGGLWDWKPSEAGSLSAPVFVASEVGVAVSGEAAVSGAVCTKLGGL